MTSSTSQESGLPHPPSEIEVRTKDSLEDLLIRLLRAREHQRDLEAAFEERKRAYEEEKVVADEAIKAVETMLMGELEHRRSRAHERLMEAERELEEVDSVARLGLGFGLSRVDLSLGQQEPENSIDCGHASPKTTTANERMEQSTWRWFDRALAVPLASVESSTTQKERTSIKDVSQSSAIHIIRLPLGQVPKEPRLKRIIGHESVERAGNGLGLTITSPCVSDSVLGSQLLYSPRTEASSTAEVDEIRCSSALSASDLRPIEEYGAQDPSPLVAVRKESLLTLLRAFDQILFNESR